MEGSRVGARLCAVQNLLGETPRQRGSSFWATTIHAAVDSWSRAVPRFASFLYNIKLVIFLTRFGIPPDLVAGILYG